MAIKKGDFVPPLLKRILKYDSKYGWHGRYKSWSEAMKHTSGYDANVILKRVSDAAIKVKNGEVVYERDAIEYDKIEVSFPLLSTLLWIASQNYGKLSLIDYGGSLGTSYRQNFPFLQNLNQLEWKIIEQKMFTDEGKAHFEDEHLKFYYNLQECLPAFENQPQLVIFSSSLPYFKEPYKVLQSVIDTNIPYLFIDRTAFINEPEDRLTIQKVPPVFYEASYPSWFFSRQKIYSFLLSEYDEVFDFKSNQLLRLGLQEIEYTGSLLKRKTK